ncbi:hypothetical protein B484DRAFT_389668 [Ochromonadaceae sp. CCMP2298]|nr:hypothetical protein B484DRAFT_389668 [Ochromonadaceae sp. CCMP2298]
MGHIGGGGARDRRDTFTPQLVDRGGGLGLGLGVSESFGVDSDDSEEGSEGGSEGGSQNSENSDHRKQALISNYFSLSFKATSTHGRAVSPKSPGGRSPGGGDPAVPARRMSTALIAQHNRHINHNRRAQHQHQSQPESEQGMGGIGTGGMSTGGMGTGGMGQGQGQGQGMGQGQALRRD